VKSSCSIDENNEYAQSCLDAVMEAVLKDDEHDEFCGGANSYKTTEGKDVFLTQAKSYHHCCPAFGMVQANVGQKLLKRNILQVFLMTHDEF
jgi:hypothetical protein